MKNKIIYVGGFILPDQNAAAHRVLSNAKIFRDLGYDVNLIGVTKKDISKDIFASKKFFQGFNCFEISYPNTKIKWIRYLSSIRDLIKIARSVGLNNIHSIIVYNYPSLSLFKLINFCSKHQIKIIADSTEWYLVENGLSLFRYIKNVDNSLRMKYLHYRCNGIICISEYLNDFYKNKIITVQLPALVDLTEEKWLNEFPTLDITKEFTFVGSPSRLGEKESFINVLLAFSKLSKNYNFKFNIIGVSKNELLKESLISTQLIEDLGDKIKLWGVLENKDCIKMINKSHFFIFTRTNSVTTEAGFPTKYVESISSGTPVLTNKTSNLKDFVIEGKNGFWIDMNNIDKQLEFCLNMSNDSIKEMKEYCLNSRVFNYSNYSDVVSGFLSRL